MSKLTRFFHEMNKKLVERSPLSKVYPFNKVNGDGKNHIGAKSVDNCEDKKETDETTTI